MQNNNIFNLNRIKYINDDCIKILQEMESESVDLIFADPPFNLKKEYEKNMDLFSYYQWCKNWIDESFRVLKKNGSFFLMTIGEHVGYMHVYLSRWGIFRNQIIWFNSSMPVKNRFCLGYQPILWFVKSLKNYTFNYGIEKRESSAAIPWGRKNNAGSIRDLWDDIPFISGGCMASSEAILRENTKKKFHPAQMPIKLAERIILYCSNPGDLILDPFAGIATVGIACAKNDRNYIGIEKSYKYYLKGIERIQIST